MFVLNVKVALPLVVASFLLATGAAGLGASYGSSAPLLGTSAQAALLVVVLGLIVIIGFIGYRIIAET